MIAIRYIALSAISIWAFQRLTAQELPPPPSWAARFEKNSKQLSEDNRTFESIGRALQYLKENPNKYMMVIGSADTLERHPYRLAEKRAERMHALLVTQGVAPERLYLRSLGSDDPVPIERCRCVLLRPVSILSR